MADLSDEELTARLTGAAGQAAPVAAAAPAVDYSKWSDDDFAQALTTAPPPVAAALPSGADLIAEAKGKGSYVPTEAEAQAMADDLAAISAKGSPAEKPVEQMRGTAREIALPASGVAKGALSMLSLPGEAFRVGANAYSKYIGAPLQSFVTGNPSPPVFSGRNPFDAEAVVGAGRKLGIVDRPDLVPQTTREKLEAAAAEGVGGTLPLALVTGGAAALPNLLMQGAGSGAGAEIAKEAAPSHPIAASLVGALLGGRAGGAAYNVGARTANALSGVSSPVVEAYHRLGIAPELAGDVTGRPGLQQLQAFSANAPGGAGRIHQAGERAVAGFANAVDRTAANLGGAQSAEEAGRVLQTEARTWRDAVFPARQAAAWAPVDAAIPPGTATPLTHYRTNLAAVTGALGRLQQTGAVLMPQRAQQLLNAIMADLPAGAPATWQEAQRLRSLIGEARGVPEIAESIGSQHLARLYGALSDDMRATAAANGVAAEFNAANAVSTQGHSFIENVLSRIIRSRNPVQESIRPEAAAESALRGGDTTLQAIRHELPAAADELAAYKLRDMALATPGRAGAGGGGVSPGTFLTEINKLRQNAPAGTRALFADPRATQAIDDLSTVAAGIRGTADRLNHSHTGTHNQLAALFGLAEAIPAGLMGHYYGGLPGGVTSAVAATALPFAGGNLAARLSSSNVLTRFMSTPVAQLPPRVNRLVPTAGGAVPAILPYLDESRERRAR